MNPEEGASSQNLPALHRVMSLLAVCLALQSIGAGALSIVFARKISSLDRGTEVFGLGMTLFSLAALIAAPYMGLLADRCGKHRLLLGSLAAHALACLATLWAPTGGAFVAVRVVAGALTAGLVPASIGMVGDLSPQSTRGRWVGFVTGWAGIGFVLGPPLGGWVYDRWGLAAPFLVATAAHALACLVALVFVPSKTTRTTQLLQDGIKKAPGTAGLLSRLNPWALIPRPYHTWAVLGAISSIAVFAWRFVEPQFHFFIYDALGWTSARFGLAISGYALLMVFAQTALGSLSDRFGRRPVLILGLVVHTAQYVALIATRSPIWITLGIAGSGLGEGLFMPALNATYLDLAPEQGRSRAIGFKECMFSLGGLAGPALVIVATHYLQPAIIFIIGGALILGSAFLVPFLSCSASGKRQTQGLVPE